MTPCCTGECDHIYCVTYRHSPKLPEGEPGRQSKGQWRWGLCPPQGLSGSHYLPPHCPPHPVPLGPEPEPRAAASPLQAPAADSFSLASQRCCPHPGAAVLSSADAADRTSCPGAPRSWHPRGTSPGRLGKSSSPPARPGLKTAAPSLPSRQLACVLVPGQLPSGPWALPVLRKCLPPAPPAGARPQLLSQGIRQWL